MFLRSSPHDGSDAKASAASLPELSTDQHPFIIIALCYSDVIVIWSEPKERARFVVLRDER